MTQFNDTELTAAVIKSFEETPDPRVKFLMEELVKSLHDYVRKTDLTFDEWALCDRFPDPRRPEMHARAGRSSSCCRTCSGFRCWSMPSTTGSARARPRPPCSARSMSASTSRCRTAPTSPPNLTGERMFVQSRVTDLKGKPLAGVPVDVWHADDDGYYDSQRPDYETEGPSIAGAVHHRRRWPVFLPHHPALQLSDPDRRSGRTR